MTKSMNENNKGLEKKLYDLYKDRIDNYSIQQLEILMDVIGLLDASQEELKAFGHIFATRIGELKQLDICKNYNYKLTAFGEIKKNDKLITIKCEHCNKQYAVSLNWLESNLKTDNKLLCHNCRDKSHG